jgi:hypothetical protein
VKSIRLACNFAKIEAMLQGKSLRIPSHGSAVLALRGLYGLKGFFSDPVLIPLPE